MEERFQREDAMSFSGSAAGHSITDYHPHRGKNPNKLRAAVASARSVFDNSADSTNQNGMSSNQSNTLVSTNVALMSNTINVPAGKSILTNNNNNSNTSAVTMNVNGDVIFSYMQGVTTALHSHRLQYEESMARHTQAKTGEAEKSKKEKKKEKESAALVVPATPNLLETLLPDQLRIMSSLHEELSAIMEDIIKPRYEKDTVQNCWVTLKRNDAAVLKFGLRMAELLEQEMLHDPEPFYPDMLISMTPEKQARLFLKFIDEAVSMYKAPYEMIEKIPHICAQHRYHGIELRHFYYFRNAVIQTLKEMLFEEDYALCEADWSRFWALTIDLMNHGVTTEESSEKRQQFLQKSALHTKHMMELIARRQENLPLPRQFIGSMFISAAAANPAYKAFFTVFETQRASDRLLQAILKVAENSSDESMLVYLREIGARHRGYGATPDLMREFAPHFVEAAKKLMEKEWTVTTNYLLSQLYKFLSEGMIDGMDSGRTTGENKSAPDGSEPFCLVFTDIESSTNLWQHNPIVMKEAVERHHRMIRTVIADNGGYEVKTVGDSFIIAAKDVFVGMKIAVGIQLELMRHLPIAPGFEMLEEVQGGGDPNAWSNQTLRVRIGIEHCTQATATYDTIHRRYDYYGPSVNQCARIEAAAAGGQILMSRDTFKALKAIPAFHDEPCPAHLRDVAGKGPVDKKGFDHFVATYDVGKVKLKGIKKEVRLSSFVPLCFAGRDFSDYMEKVLAK
ncbi:Adenylate and Guanylate cyclase catalytic domain containing protein, putative [Angomonas deanei]|uniref:Adenylate and Guanylate cyclase catalytic domain containing protein, putative n=1 Tax=Angomonas deanei TaxID=59799 RepID=A0A7G2CSY3_9TRYP|nr:Adenylate and Guanylate cyclase catalytic domain containing protein, putative [Angomonas deanei]